MNTEPVQTPKPQIAPISAKASRLDASSGKEVQQNVATPALRSDWKSDVATHVGELDKTIRDFITQKPILAAACAVSLGFAINLLLKKPLTEKSSEL